MVRGTLFCLELVTVFLYNISPLSPKIYKQYIYAVLTLYNLFNFIWFCVTLSIDPDKEIL